MIKKILAPLYTYDITIIIFLLALSSLNGIFHAVIPSWILLTLANVAISMGVVFLAYLDHRTSSKVVRFLHHWYAAPIVFLTFKQLYIMIPAIRSQDYDDLLIAIDRWLFGTDPTVWISQFSHPLITEILQIAYASFYFLFLIVGYELYRKGDLRTFLYLVYLIVYGFFLSYAGYFLLPAVGPRFTLHDFNALNDELPGLVFTNALRDFVNAGGSIPRGVPNPAEFTQRDVFPSGHTMMTLVLMYVVWKFRLKTKVFIHITGILLMIATVYMRYHYVIDLIAGAVFMIVCLWTAPKLHARWERVRRSLST